jgi:enoyl-CoA hydratase
VLRPAGDGRDARIGYMPTRVWGCPTTAMWTYRLGPTRAKQLMFTGDTIDGTTAAAWGLANEAVPADQLEAATMALANRIAGVPRSHLAMHKMVVNQVMLAMGLEQSQQMATVFDGITRHNPEGLWFRRYAQERASRPRCSGATAASPSPRATKPAR